jgi:hypothetical protein
MYFRYEDVTQDGRVRLEAMTASLGVVWRRSLGHHSLYPACRAQGILPILTRFVIEGEPGPFAVEGKVDVDGRFDMTRTVDERGQIDRLLLVIRAMLTAPRGRTNLPPPPDAGASAKVGTVLAEHVFTRPFALPEQRKVLGIEGVDLPVHALAVQRWPAPQELLELPEGARPIEDALAPEPSPIVFGPAHTDSNQHVNSLVYPRLFEEAILRRLAALGLRTDRLARSVDVRYRKPSFQGDSVRIVLRLYERGARVGAVGVFAEPSGPVDRGRAFLRMELE